MILKELVVPTLIQEMESKEVTLRRLWVVQTHNYLVQPLELIFSGADFLREVEVTS